MPHFRKFAEKYPLEVLNHSYKHGYHELADRTAPHTVSFRLPAVAAKLTCPGLLQKWVRVILLVHVHTLIRLLYHLQIAYYDHWMELSRFTWLWMHDSPYTRCGKVISWQVEFFKAFAENPRTVFSLPPISPFTSDCPYGNNCHIGDMNALFLQLARQRDTIPKFTSILTPSR